MYQIILFGIMISNKKYTKEKANILYKNYIEQFGFENVKFVYLG